MTGQVVAVFHDPWIGLAEAPISLGRPVLLWRKAIWFKANPRTADYMRERLVEHWPNARFIDTALDPDWIKAVSTATRVILLYPDAVGLGYGHVERIVHRAAPNAALEVLNGRRRAFALDRQARRGLMLRRFFERSMLLELVMGLGLLIATPVLLALDVSRGHR